ncbi:hypothetical protein ACLKA7_001382 [Drosophila subpalustris]
MEEEGSDDNMSVNTAPMMQSSERGRPWFTLKDVEGSVNKFDGSNSMDIEQWVTELEECAMTVQWSDLQLFVYAKQLLVGAAKSFIRSQRGINNWEMLKAALKGEFEIKLSSAEVHKRLGKRQQKKDELPVYQHPRRIAVCDQEIVDEQVKEWLSEKIIRPSTSEYASPVVLVAKKNGKKCLCCDNRKLNEKVIRDNFPMPQMDSVIEKLQGLKLKGKYLGPYKVLEVKNHGRYEVEKVGIGEGPCKTTTVSEYMKLWDSFGSNDLPGRPNVGTLEGEQQRTIRSGHNF